MIVKTKDGTARFYKGYTITGEGTEITDEAMLTRFKDHALFVVEGGKKKKKQPVPKPEPVLAEKPIELNMSDEELDVLTAPENDD